MNTTQTVNYTFRDLLSTALRRQLLTPEDSIYIASRAHINFFGLSPKEPAAGHVQTLSKIAKNHAGVVRRYLEGFRSHAEGLGKCCNLNVIL